jgi:hypothetical protein
VTTRPPQSKTDALRSMESADLDRPGMKAFLLGQVSPDQPEVLAAFAAAGKAWADTDPDFRGRLPTDRSRAELEAGGPYLDRRQAYDEAGDS